ncbi:MAG: energy-coupling factor ABC transporter permease [Actinomycetota bacterium]|jgi:cobalt/nickel transport system permease protein
MHIPDGFINAGTSLAGGVAAAGGLTVCARRAADFLDDKAAPLAGLVAAFVFAAQMLNFPVAAGTSGHLIGGALAAVLVGPWVGAVCVTVVVVVQALLFADGGLSALGLNVLNLALVTSLVGYGVFAILRRALRNGRPSVVVAAGVAACLSVVASSLAFVVQYAIGGTGAVALGTVLTAMAGVHLLIGIGEGVITAMAVSTVLAVRPDLVYGARHLARPLEVVPRAAAAGEA